MSPELERMAAAIGAELIRQELAGEDFSEAESNEHLARAALLSIREPSEGMKQAAIEDAGEPYCIGGGEATSCWQTMIDHILGEEPKA